MINFYEPKVLRGAIRRLMPLRLFFRNRFFSETVTFPTRAVSFEFAADKRLLLPYADPALPAPGIERNAYQRRTFIPPLTSGSRTVTEETAMMKMFGESEWNSGKSPDERAAETAANDLMELQDGIFRKEEYMCARVKQDGKLVTDTGEIDFGFSGTENTTSSAKWAAEYDILGKLKGKAKELRKDGTNPDMLILGSDAADAFMKNKGVQEMLKAYPGLIEPHDDLEDGVNWLCRVRVPGLFLDVYEYGEYYADPKTGSAVPVMDAGTAILQSSKESNYMLFGAVTYVKDGAFASETGEYVPYTVYTEDPPAVKLVVSSRSLPMPRDVDSWCVMKNVV